MGELCRGQGREPLIEWSWGHDHATLTRIEDLNSQRVKHKHGTRLTERSYSKGSLACYHHASISENPKAVARRTKELTRGQLGMNVR